jgi:hypothetical protein
MTQTLRLLLVCENPILHELLHARLSGTFDVSSDTNGHASALATARRAQADVVLVDTDETDLVAGLSLICPAPVVALSVSGAPGTPAATALYQAGACAVLHKQAGRLPLDLNSDFGDAIVTSLRAAVA